MSTKAVEYLKQNFKQKTLEDLIQLSRIQSVSFDGFDPTEVKRSAETVTALMKKAGLENVQLLSMPGVHPYAYGEWLKAPGAPTLLLYAHHDVQPPGREDLWVSPPFEPTLREGPGGVRLYGRGTADDKAGVMVHLAAIDAILKTAGKLPVNVKLIVEGEEEIGSTHLVEFLAAHREMLKADVICLTDTANFDCGVPALTVALRGLIEFEIEVRALKGAVHSGVWGGPIPDPAMALCKALSTLTDEFGRIAVDSVWKQVRPVTSDEAKHLRDIPYDEKEFCKQAGLVASSKPLRDSRYPDVHPGVQVWRLPSLTVNALQASSRKQAGNIINDTAWAKVTIRVVADMNPSGIAEEVKKLIESRIPWGLESRVEVKGAVGAWSVPPSETGGPVFKAAEKALEQGYGKKPLYTGCGGTIPFVKPFADAMGGAPCLLIGVEDPYTNAHGENESLLVSDLEKACVSQVLLFEKLGELK